jgi:hypothetical protein
MPDFPSISANAILKIGRTEIVCPKHGTHPHIISSTMTGHEGRWCQLCWLESLGPSLPLADEQSDV